MLDGGWKNIVVAVLMTASLAILLAACGSPQGPAAAASPGEPQAVAVNVAPAKVGNISVTTSYAAIVEAKDQVDVVPLAIGRVEKLTVDVGFEVQEGQVIAELSHGTLDAQLQQAQAKLASVRAATEPNELKAQAQLDAARARLSQLLNPPAFDLKVAESAVAMAQSKLDNAKTKSAVATAQSELDSAKTKLNLVLNPLASDIQAAKSTVTTTQITLDSANTKLDQLLIPSAADLQLAQNWVATAQSNVDSAKTKLDQLLNPSPSDLAAGREAVADARVRLSSAQLRLNQAIAKEPSAPWQTLLSARIALQANQTTLEHPSLNFELTSEEIADAEEAVAANQEQITIQLRHLRSATMLVQEDRFNTRSLISEEIRIALWNESEALNALETSRANFQELQNPSQESVALAQNSVAVAQSALDSAKVNLRVLQKPSQRTVALEQNNIARGQASLDAAKERLKELQSPSQSTISLAQNNVAIAEAALASAEAQVRYDVGAALAALDSASAKLNQLKTPRPAELAAAKTGVAIAEQTLALNQENYTRHKIQAAQANVDQIEQQLAETQVLAPFDGVVTQIWLSIGAMASSRPKTPIVTVASKDVVVSLRVEETGVAAFQEGQRVQFTSPGLPAKHLELRIDLVAPTGEQEAHTFLVQMRPLAAVPDLKPGLSGEVSIVAERNNVILVPREAVRRQGSQFSLFVVRDARARLIEVDGGLIDDKNMEILDGVQPGDLVVVSGQNLLNESSLVTVVVN